MQQFARVTRGREVVSGRPAKAHKARADVDVSCCANAAPDASEGSEGEEVCAVCNSGARAATMLLCDGLGCETAMHIGCVQPPLSAVPRGDWFCPSCDPYADVGPRAQKAWLLSPSAATRAPRADAASDGARSLRPTTVAKAAATLQAAARTAEHAERAQLVRRLRAAARDLHYSSTPEALLCRAAEFTRLREFIGRALETGRGGGLYVSGTPGNGKTVTINLVREQIAREMNLGELPFAPVIFLNAFAFVDSPAELYTAIDSQLAAAAKHGVAGASASSARVAALAHAQRGKARAQAALANLEARFASARPAQPPEPARRGERRVAQRGAQDAPARDDAPPANARVGRADGAARGRPALARARVVVVVVDEIDALYEASGDDVLCRLFEWAALPHSPLVLIGIANAIDLTERMIPALARRGCSPAVLTFPPYAPDDIVAILEERLARAGARPDASAPIVARAALEFCARKVCAASSDARCALDICRGALELALSQIEDDDAGARARAPCDAAVTPAAGARARAGGGVGAGAPAGAAAPLAVVSVPLMAKVVSSLFKSRIVELCASLPQHQQLLMCAAVLHFREAGKPARAAPVGSAPFGASKRPAAGAVGVGGARGPTTLRDLHDAYSSLCRSQAVRPISASEMVPACHALAASGLIHVNAPGPGRPFGHAPAGHGVLDKNVSVAIAPEELALAVQEVRFFRQILATPSAVQY